MDPMHSAPGRWGRRSPTTVTVPVSAPSATHPSHAPHFSPGRLKHPFQEHALTLKDLTDENEGVIVVVHHVLHGQRRRVPWSMVMVVG